MKLYYYRSFTIQKSDGSVRSIREPNDFLKRAQKKINNLIPDNITDCIQGFTPGKSIITNALVHINAIWSIHIDIRHFFPTIGSKQIHKLFKFLNIPLYYIDLVTDKDNLPQGSPASPKIANWVAFRIDNRLQKLCNDHNLKYSRYADDISISGEKDFDLNKLEKVVYHIINSSGFKVKPSKTHRYIGSERIITGIIIRNKKLYCDPKIIIERDNLIQQSRKKKLTNKNSQKLNGLNAFIKSIELANQIERF